MRTIDKLINKAQAIMINHEVLNYSVTEGKTATGWPILRVKATMRDSKQQQKVSSSLTSFSSTCTRYATELIRDIRIGTV